MSRCHRLLAVVVALSFTTAAPAAIQFPNQPKNTTGIEKMRQGIESPTAGSNKEAISDLAKWLAHRLVHPPFNGQTPPKATSESLETLLQDAERYFTMANPRVPPNDNQIAYQRELGEQMANELLYVMGETVNKLEKVNAARMLALSGKLYCEKLADVYLTLLREEKYPREIKLFAYQGLRNLLAIPDPHDPKRHILKDVVKKDAKNKEAPPVVESWPTCT